jgi:hypothetical protein
LVEREDWWPPDCSLFFCWPTPKQADGLFEPLGCRVCVKCVHVHTCKQACFHVHVCTHSLTKNSCDTCHVSRSWWGHRKSSKYSKSLYTDTGDFISLSSHGVNSWRNELIYVDVCEFLVQSFVKYCMGNLSLTGLMKIHFSLYSIKSHNSSVSKVTSYNLNEQRQRRFLFFLSFFLFFFLPSCPE